MRRSRMPRTMSGMATLVQTREMADEVEEARDLLGVT